MENENLGKMNILGCLFNGKYRISIYRLKNDNDKKSFYFYNTSFADISEYAIDKNDEIFTPIGERANIIFIDRNIPVRFWQECYLSATLDPKMILFFGEEKIIKRKD